MNRFKEKLSVDFGHKNDTFSPFFGHNNFFLKKIKSFSITFKCLSLTVQFQKNLINRFIEKFRSADFK